MQFFSEVDQKLVDVVRVRHDCSVSWLRKFYLVADDVSGGKAILSMVVVLICFYSSDSKVCGKCYVLILFADVSKLDC